VTYRHTLTPLEESCGVTLDDVARYLQGGAFFDNGRAWHSEAQSPALAMSVARCAFAGAEIRYAGPNSLGHSVYRIDNNNNR
jgi:hypothetical protein